MSDGQVCHSFIAGKMLAADCLRCRNCRLNPNCNLYPYTLTLKANLALCQSFRNVTCARCLLQLNIGHVIMGHPSEFLKVWQKPGTF